jgi:NAD(P)-dependent dehydrogenase (short-subunit alcohol dehydrogenase family)
MSQQTSEHVALNFGANKGIGFEVARQLGEHGITLLIGSRNPHRGEQAASALQVEGVKARALKWLSKSSSSRESQHHCPGRGTTW